MKSKSFIDFLESLKIIIIIIIINSITVKLNVNHSLDTAENVDETVAEAEKDPNQAPAAVLFRFISEI